MDQYRKLPRKGKPAETEWTVLAGIAMERAGRFTAVALATGTKCLSANRMLETGQAINDSHAEVLTRRAFRRFLLEQVRYLAEGSESIFLAAEGGGPLSLHEGVSFHLYVSEVPCGEASPSPPDPSSPMTPRCSSLGRPRCVSTRRRKELPALSHKQREPSSTRGNMSPTRRMRSPL